MASQWATRVWRESGERMVEVVALSNLLDEMLTQPLDPRGDETHAFEADGVTPFDPNRRS